MFVCGKVTMSAESNNIGVNNRTWAEEIDADSKSTVNSSMSDANESSRDISLEFLDGANEQKFEKLVKEEKLNTPFKRRHSQTPSIESRSNSPNSSCGSHSNGDHNVRINSRLIEKRARQNSYNSSCSSISSYTESDPSILSRRQKQIEYGKNTVAYERYISLVPRSDRTRDHPRTPNKYGKYSRRAFDGLIKIWRKQLHYYDPPTQNQSQKDSSSDSESS